MRKMAILCVDDENYILHALKGELTNLFDDKYAIELAESGPEAIEVFQELSREGFDIPVVISDYVMPGMKGDAVLARIHKLSPMTLKIMLTGQAALEGITNAINNANLFRYFEKPWNKSELRSTVVDAVESYYQNQKLTAEYQKLLVEQEKLEDKIKRAGMTLKTELFPAKPSGNSLLLRRELGDSLSKIKSNIVFLEKLCKEANPVDPQVIEDYLTSEQHLYEDNNQEITKLIADIKKIQVPVLTANPHSEEEENG